MFAECLQHGRLQKKTKRKRTDCDEKDASLRFHFCFYLDFDFWREKLEKKNGGILRHPSFWADMHDVIHN